MEKKKKTKKKKKRQIKLAQMFTFENGRKFMLVISHKWIH